MSEEDKIMDKINKNLNIIDDFLIENGFNRYIANLVKVESYIGEIYDLLKYYKLRCDSDE